MSEFYTVSQFAKANGKDPGNIRRMLNQGLLPGEKVGSQWLIPKGTEYPKDRRIKNGEYIKWRQKVRLGSRHPGMLKKLTEMCEAISKIYEKSIVEVILYGSYSRGQENEESDIDIALVLSAKQTSEQYDCLTDLVVDYELELGVTLSIISIDQCEFNEWKTFLPFYKNVEKEGIVIWKNE